MRPLAAKSRDQLQLSRDESRLSEKPPHWIDVTAVSINCRTKMLLNNASFTIPIVPLVYTVHWCAGIGLGLYNLALFYENQTMCP